MKLLIFLISVYVSAGGVHADQLSERHRIDDCFADLNGMIEETNHANQTYGSGADLAEINRRYAVKKKRCWDAKELYEKQFGKYAFPKPKSLSQAAIIKADRENARFDRLRACGLRDTYYSSKYDFTSSRAESDGKSAQEQLKELLIRHKKVTGESINPEKDCGMVPESEDEFEALRDFNMGEGREPGKVTATELGESICNRQGGDPDDKRFAGFRSLYKRATHTDFDMTRCPQKVPTPDEN